MEFLGGCHLFEAERLLEKIPYFYSLILTLLISDMFDQLQKHNSYITFNRESFPHNPSFRLINPSKSDISKVKKTI